MRACVCRWLAHVCVCMCVCVRVPVPVKEPTRAETRSGKRGATSGPIQMHACHGPWFCARPLALAASMHACHGPWFCARPLALAASTCSPSSTARGGQSSRTASQPGASSTAPILSGSPSRQRRTASPRTISRPSRSKASSQDGACTACSVRHTSHACYPFSGAGCGVWGVGSCAGACRAHRSAWGLGPTVACTVAPPMECVLHATMRTVLACSVTTQCVLRQQS